MEPEAQWKQGSARRVARPTRRRWDIRCWLSKPGRQAFRDSLIGDRLAHDRATGRIAMGEVEAGADDGVDGEPSVPQE